MLRPVSRTLSVLFWLSCLCGGEAWGQPPYLVKDISPGEAPASSWAAYPAATDDLLFFWADLPSIGFELWRSDGTPAGTFPLLDIWPGLNTSDPNGSDANKMAALGDILLFGANDGSTGPELWRSDGTPEGTFLVADLTPGPWGSEPNDLTEAGGLGFFWRFGETFELELWRTDGTAPGTFEIDLGPDVGFSFRPIDVDGTLFFFADDRSVGHLTLWKSDGNSASEISPGTSDWLFVDQMIAVNGLAFFTIWNGTVRVKLLPPGSYPDALTAVGGRLFFSVDDPATGRELWVSDGTEAGTRLVVDLEPGPRGSLPLPGEIVDGFGRAVFAAADSLHGLEIWASDGTAAGTVLLRDIAEGRLGALPPSGPGFPIHRTPQSGGQRRPRLAPGGRHVERTRRLPGPGGCRGWPDARRRRERPVPHPVEAQNVHVVAVALVEIAAHPLRHPVDVAVVGPEDDPGPRRRVIEDPVDVLRHAPVARRAPADQLDDLDDDPGVLDHPVDLLDGEAREIVIPPARDVIEHGAGRGHVRRRRPPGLLRRGDAGEKRSPRSGDRLDRHPRGSRGDCPPLPRQPARRSR